MVANIILVIKNIFLPRSVQLNDALKREEMDRQKEYERELKAKGQQ